MDVLLVSGFLGAGKTTLIKHFLESKVHAEQKIAVIVNEVGKIGIDGALLAGRDVDIVELTSGCICCTIKTDFYQAVQEIHQRVNPAFLVVEATGVAQPGDMVDIFFEPPVSEFSRMKSLITVVDADFFEAREVLGSFYDNQIICADILILNKIDEVSSERLEKIEAVLHELNPEANILRSQYCAVDISELFRVELVNRHQRSQQLHHSNHHSQAGFHTFSFEDQHPMDREKFVQFLESLPPTVFRCKGWIQFKDASGLVNFTGGSYRIEPVEDNCDTSLVFVGRNCKQEEILRALEECLDE